MIESLFVRKHSIAKHRSGPLLKEREEYLQYLSTQDIRALYAGSAVRTSQCYPPAGVCTYSDSAIS
jgi:hypothetical protein